MVTLLGGGAGLVLAERASAQTIVVEKSTIGCQAGRWTVITPDPAPNPGDPIEISGIDDSWTTVRVRFSGGLAQVGRVTLSGTRASSVPLDLFLTTQDCLPQTPDTPVPSGSVSATSWSGLTYGAGSESVRDAVRLTAAISGDLTGAIDCGTIYRLQVGGSIKAAVTAAGPNREGVGAIGVIVAQRVENDGSGTLTFESVCGIDPDFNRDGNPDKDDLTALITAVAGRGCP